MSDSDEGSFVKSTVGVESTFNLLDIEALALRFGRPIGEIPYSIRILIENAGRNLFAEARADVTRLDVERLIHWEDNIGAAVPLYVERILLPDSSGLPALLDLAALRGGLAAAGGDPHLAEPRIPVDVVIDHSLQVDWFGDRQAASRNLSREIERNLERYRFLKWASQAFRGISVHPPSSGIIHQLNLELIAHVVRKREHKGQQFAVPDLMIGGDSHTPMINGLGVLGWGVGGIDAEAAMLGSPYLFAIPNVVGVRMTGKLRPGIMTTDLMLALTQRLRREGVAGSFVEYFGPGATALTIPERASIANMAPEYGATCGYFPVDASTIEYLKLTRFNSVFADFVKAYCQSNALFRGEGAPDPHFSRVVSFDLSEVTTSVAGPKRPQDRLGLDRVGADFRTRLGRALADDGFAVSDAAQASEVASAQDPKRLQHGSIVIAAITSCANTSNPRVMLAAGLLARKARSFGLRPPAYVKTSLAPGSRVVTAYLQASGFMSDLEALGFYLVGYGCTTCGGKSGPLLPEVSAEIESNDLVVASVLSGNRNFEGRIHRQVRANYIMSPPLVVAFALAGRIDVALDVEPLATTADGQKVYLKDLWPSEAEIDAAVSIASETALFRNVYGRGNGHAGPWNEITASSELTYGWDSNSTYLVPPPFFDDDVRAERLPALLSGARVLGLFGDSVTTDHISPGGEIPLESPSGRYLIQCGVKQNEFNTYVARRGNHEVMTRATFANIRIKNLLEPDREGWFTRDPVSGGTTTIYEASRHAKEAGIPLIVLAGDEYGTGSSRDWAAKGTALLGVRIVIANSFERIHRSNLIGMGVLPLLFPDEKGWKQLGIDGSEWFTFEGIDRALTEGASVRVTAVTGKKHIAFEAQPAVLNDAERRLLRNGGILSTIFSELLVGQS